MRYLTYILVTFFILTSCNNQEDIQTKKSNSTDEIIHNPEDDGRQIAKLSCEIGELKYQRIHGYLEPQEYSKKHNTLNKKLSDLHTSLKKRYKEDKKALERLGDIWEQEVLSCEKQLELKYGKPVR